MSYNNARTVKYELLKLANNRLLDADLRKDELSKLAAGRMDRNFLSKERKKAIKGHEKARKLFSDLSSQLGDLQSRVQKAEEDMNAARDSMLDLNKIIEVMDLIGATDAKKEKDGDCSYTVDGSKVHADTSDPSNIRIVPWGQKDSLKADDSEEKEEEEPTDLVDEMRMAEEDALSFIPLDDDEDLSDEEILSEIDGLDWLPEDDDDDFFGEKAASVESKLITKIAKKFR